MVVIDSSTLILIAKAGLLDILLKKTKLIIPRAVQRECLIKDSLDAKLIERRIKESKIIVGEIKKPSICNKLINDFKLGIGEAESITMALENQALLITDDKRAIKVCNIFQVEFTTAINILVGAHKNHLIDSIQSTIILNKLINYGRYSQEIIQKAKEDLK